MTSKLTRAELSELVTRLDLDLQVLRKGHPAGEVPSVDAGCEASNMKIIQLADISQEACAYWPDADFTLGYWFPDLRYFGRDKVVGLARRGRWGMSERQALYQVCANGEVERVEVPASLWEMVKALDIALQAKDQTIEALRCDLEAYRDDGALDNTLEQLQKSTNTIDELVAEVKRLRARVAELETNLASETRWAKQYHDQWQAALSDLRELQE